jgi:hypothetical protein
LKSWLRLAICTGLLASDLALAQDGIPRTEREEERAGIASVAARGPLDAADEAALFVPWTGARVRYEDVLARPDDVELSFRYALGQVNDGQLGSAVATLERILLLRPDFMRVRMLYAVVLYRLGNLPEAEQELVRVADAPGAGGHRQQIDAYLERIRRERQHTRTSFALSGGTQHDTNRNSGPESNQSVFGGTRFDLGNSDGRKTSDGGWFSAADLRLERDLGSQEQSQLIANASYYHSQQDDLSSFDVQALHFELGLRQRKNAGELSPRLVADVVDLSRESYLRSAGFEVAAERALSSRLALRGRGRVVHEDFDAIQETRSASERSGLRTDVGTTLAIALAASQRLELSAGAVRKAAKESHQAYLGWELGASHLWLLPAGSFVLGQLSAARDEYLDDQDAIGPSRRRDFRTRMRLTGGTPLASWLGGERFPALRGLIVSVNGELLLTDSNLPNYQFRNRRVGISLSRRFDF